MRKIFLLSMLLFAPLACGSGSPRPDHIVIVIEENKSFTQIIGNPDAPYINALARRGMLSTASTADTGANTIRWRTGRN